MATMRFEELEAWKHARKLVGDIYKITCEDKLARDFGLSSHIQRSAVSTMSNIAEGFERTGKAEKLNFYNIARASCGEVRSLLYVIEDNYPDNQDKAIVLRKDAETVGRLISGLISSTRRRIITKASMLLIGFLLPITLIALSPIY